MKAIVLAAVMAAVVGCAHVKDVVRTVKDVGIDLCRLHFSEQPEQASALAGEYGVSVRDLCKVADVVNPFVDQALSAQRAGAQALGLEAK